MCGIAGELRFDGTAPDASTLARMLAPLARRGPDHAGRYTDGPLALGHRRLSIIDLSERSNQPLADPDNELVLVFNGTIYNYRELRTELATLGQRFHTDGDSEVILKAYAAWGEGCVGRFIGMFAFAIWDRRRKALFLARDRLGIKPLYYTLTRNALRFASNIQALLAAGDVDTRIDPVALHHHLTLHAVVPAPRTLLAGVHKLAPAHTLAITPDGSHRLHRYWTLRAERPAHPPSEWEWIEQVRAALFTAIERRRLAADVPVGVLLSGGLDSSLLVALLAESGAARDLHTFSIGFEDTPEERGNEFEFSDLVAAEYGTRHTRIRIANEDVLTRLPEAVSQMAEPMVGQDAVAFYLLSEQVAKSVKVVQSGQGADEVFGGYFWYPRMEEDASGEAADRFARHYFDRGHAEYLETVAPDYHGPDYTRAYVAAHLAEPGADSFLDQVFRLDVTTLIVDDPIKRVDNMTMAWGLEARVPFLDHELVELAMTIPPRLKLKSAGKHPLKAIARGLLPDLVIDRPKGYFPLPALKYVRGASLEFMREILDSPACHQRGLFQRTHVARLLADPEGQFTPLNGSKLWHLALLELWLQRVVDAVKTA
jgi:asparagine synthase (glutamine-hydrolysing)